MGGILAHAQIVTVTPELWEKAVGPVARDILARNSNNSLVMHALIFKSNPRIKRVVFICTPHRGSGMASGGIGRLAISLISLPRQRRHRIAGCCNPRGADTNHG